MSGSDRDAFRLGVESLLGRWVAGFEALVSLERLSGGASQETYRIVYRGAGGDDRLALRRPPGGHSRAGAGISSAVEAQLIRAARDVGVPEPEVLHVLEESDGLGHGFLMRWVEGEALGARIVKAPEFEAVRPRLARECGEILARIHAVDLDASGLRSVLPVVSPEENVRSTWELYRSYDTPQPMLDYTARWLLDHLPGGYTPTLVHNDFRNGNFLLTPDGVAAVLDWELAHIGDPMRDLGWICTNSWRFGRFDKPVGGFGDYADLFAGYEAVSGHKVDPERVKFWEVFGSFWWSMVCLQMADHYRNGPDKSVERAAIGRRASEGQIDCVNLLCPGPVDLLEEAAAVDSGDMPRADELLTGVREFLRGEVMESTQGRSQFLARVAANALAIVEREIAMGTPHRAAREARLRALFESEEAGLPLTRRLVEELRSGAMALDRAGLREHLRATVVNQVAIDQPRYSGYAKARSLA